ncbi:MAG: NIPSNAP family protein [Caulobacterales bacterium]|nr:NIPSNAP family protein [Caulobacterales bacterium]
MSLRILASWLLLSAPVALAMPLTAKAAAPVDPQVIELRQYKIVPGQRDAFVALFEREFVETQEAVGMGLVGQFRDLDDPDRFVWIRTFAGMPEREQGLSAFYSGPVWKAHRDAANPMLDDNDNVLLLRPARPGHGFAPNGRRAEPGAKTPPAGLVVATIYYLWKDPTEGFAATFDTRLRPELEAAGLPVLAAFTPEPTPNNFPRLPVRQGEKLFVWFTRVDNPAAYEAAMQRLAKRPGFRAALGTQLEQTPQVLRLAPTPRSALH